MQAPNPRFNFAPFPRPQSEVAYQRLLRTPAPNPAKAGMEIGGLLNARHAAAADAQLRRQIQQSMQMDGGVPYGMGQGSTLAHHQQSMHQSNGLPYGVMAQPQHGAQMYAQSYMARHENQNALTDDNFGAMRQKNETAPKAFACSTCQKGFARRSDLARHGKETSLPTREPP